MLKCTPADNEFDYMEPVYRGTCAALAAITGQIATYPIEVVRTKMTVAQPGTYKGIYDCFIQT